MKIAKILASFGYWIVIIAMIGMPDLPDRLGVLRWPVGIFTLALLGGLDFYGRGMHRREFWQPFRGTRI